MHLHTGGKNNALLQAVVYSNGQQILYAQAKKMPLMFLQSKYVLLFCKGEIKLKKFDYLV